MSWMPRCNELDDAMKKNHLIVINYLLLISAVGLSLPPARSLIEQSMLWHMAVQMPLLMLAGALGAANCSVTWRWSQALKHVQRFNQYGLTSFMAVLVILTYWMLPVAIDRAVTLPRVDAAKVGSLLLCGVFLKASLNAAPRTVQVFFIGYLLAMLVTLGVYFVTSDVRLCNAYSAESQMRTGYGLMALSAVIGMYFVFLLVVQNTASFNYPPKGENHHAHNDTIDIDNCPRLAAHRIRFGTRHGGVPH